MHKVLSTREKIILYVTVAIIFFSMGFNFFLGPILSQNDSLSKEINITKARLRKYNRLLSQKDAIHSKYAQFTRNSPPTAQTSGVAGSALAELEDLAKASGVTIVDIRPQAQNPQAVYGELFVELRAESSMDGFLKFIYAIENSLSLFQIKRLQVTFKPNTQVLEGSFSIAQLIL